MATSTLDPSLFRMLRKSKISELRGTSPKEGSARLVGKGGGPAVSYGYSLWAATEYLGLMQQGRPFQSCLLTQELTPSRGQRLWCISAILGETPRTNKISFHNAGTHGVSYLKDLMQYKQKRDQDRHEAFIRMGKKQRPPAVDKVLLPEEMTSGYQAVFDACVLVNAALRDTLLRLAEPSALYLPRWFRTISSQRRNVLWRTD